MINIKNLSNLVIQIDRNRILPNESINVDNEFSKRSDIKRLLTQGFIQICEIPDAKLESHEEVRADEPELLENSENTTNKRSRSKRKSSDTDTVEKGDEEFTDEDNK